MLFTYRENYMKNIMIALMLVLLSCFANANANANANVIEITRARVRPIFVGQTAAVFMEIFTVKRGALIKAETDIGKAELHKVMRCRHPKMYSVERFAIEANKPVSLCPGGLHIMLLGLKKPLKTGSIVPIILTFQFEDGSKDRVTVDVNVVD